MPTLLLFQPSDRSCSFSPPTICFSVAQISLSANGTLGYQTAKTRLNRKGFLIVQEDEEEKKKNNSVYNITRGTKLQFSSCKTRHSTSATEGIMA